MPAPYLLDTTVLLHWTRDSRQAQVIEANFQLSSSAMRPLICEVSLGEMFAFSLARRWGAQKLKRLADIERNAVVVHISDPGSGRSTQASRRLRRRQAGRSFTEKTIFGLVRQLEPRKRIC
jgi:predicted nucleic acid-binding protein